MKKIFLAVLLISLVLPSVLAINLSVEKLSENEAMVLGINQPAVFTVKVTNHGPADNFNFYTFFTPISSPKEKVFIEEGESKTINLEFYPPEKISPGYTSFDYYIKGTDSEISQNLVVKVAELQDVLEIGSGEVDVDSETLNIYIKNKINFDFEELDVKFSSPFFKLDEKFSLGQKERKDFTVKLNKDDFSKLKAGYYTLTAKVNSEDAEANLEKTINFIEKDIVTTTKKDTGLIISTKTIQKKNQGNAISTVEDTIKKNVLSRLFTSFSPEPDSVNREGLSFYYYWQRQINPGETFEIKVRTNWLVPFLIILAIVLIVILTKITSGRNLVLRKKIQFVKAKGGSGGEIALKVSIVVHAKKYIEKVSIMDRLPFITKIHEKFGLEIPSRIDEKNRKIEWNFEKLEQGEVRVLSYVVYSKLGVLGKFALPRTLAVYEREGQVKETQSNQTFFLAEPRREKNGE